MPSGEETMAKARRVLSTRVPDRCSFCGLTPVSKHEGVRLVVASEEAAICNLCVAIAVDVLAEQAAERSLDNSGARE
jgi:hypothetical protein